MKKTSPDTLVVGCEQANLQWQLTCKGNEWKGSYGNCTTGQSNSATEGVYQSHLHNHLSSVLSYTGSFF